MRDNELGGAYDTRGVEEKCVSWRSVKKTSHLEYLGVNGGIIFVGILLEESFEQGFFSMRYCIFCTHLTPKNFRPLFFEFLK